MDQTCRQLFAILFPAQVCMTFKIGLPIDHYLPVENEWPVCLEILMSALASALLGGDWSNTCHRLFLLFPGLKNDILFFIYRLPLLRSDFPEL